MDQTIERLFQAWWARASSNSGCAWAYNVSLIIRRSVELPIRLLMVVLYAKIFYDYRLYSDALLQIYFFAIQIYGWWYWPKGVTNRV